MKESYKNEIQNLKDQIIKLEDEKESLIKENEYEKNKNHITQIENNIKELEKELEKKEMKYNSELDKIDYPNHQTFVDTNLDMMFDRKNLGFDEDSMYDDKMNDD